MAYAGVDPQHLCDRYLANAATIRTKQIENHTIEQEWLRQMEANDATSIPGVCEQVIENTYDQLAFTPLKEILHAPDLASALTPAHQETIDVPDKWKTATVLSLAKKYGREALAIVDQARIPGSPTVRVTREIPKEAP